MCHKTFRKWFHYLSLLHCYLELEVTGKRVNRGGGYGLEIQFTFRFYGPEKATHWLETRLTKIEEQLREPKLFPQIKFNFLVEQWFCDTQY